MPLRYTPFSIQSPVSQKTTCKHPYWEHEATLLIDGRAETYRTVRPRLTVKRKNDSVFFADLRNTIVDDNADVFALVEPKRSGVPPIVIRF